MGARLTLLVVCLLWPAQMLTVAGIFTSISQAAIAQHFQTTQIAWFALIYTLVGCLLTPFVAKFGDMFGKRRVMLIITAIGVVGDVITAIAPSYEWMLVGRVLAAGYAPIMALVFATIRDVFPPKYVGTASGAVGAGTGIFVTLCPLLAGALLDLGGYQAVLWTLSGMTFIAFLLILAFVPETPRHSSGAHFDWIGGLLLGAAVTTLVYVVGQIGIWGWSDAKTLGLIALALILGSAFVVVELKTQFPLLNVRMFKRRAFSTVILSSSLGQGATFAGATMIVFLALFPHIPGISDSLGWSGTQTAFVGMPAGIVGLVAGVLAGVVTSRLDPRRPFVAGLAVAVVGSVLQSMFHSTELEVILTSVVLAAGTGMILACGPAMIVRTVSPDEQGIASGMSVLLSNLFTAVVAQIMYVSLASGGAVANGTRFYLDAGFRNAYLAFAGVFAVALVIALVIPRLPLQQEILEGHGDIAPVEVTAASNITR
ncbi:MFS transporter [Arthrobacter sp. 2MCAF15]|uniref:MFS transporter n=1 Tax=Arthrobacter sp. 2MCAF15 TaxID=3232984 RepID=UPI003F929F84